MDISICWFLSASAEQDFFFLLFLFHINKSKFPFLVFFIAQEITWIIREWTFRNIRIKCSHIVTKIVDILLPYFCSQIKCFHLKWAQKVRWSKFFWRENQIVFSNRAFVERCDDNEFEIWIRNLFLLQKSSYQSSWTRIG